MRLVGAEFPSTLLEQVLIGVCFGEGYSVTASTFDSGACEWLLSDFEVEEEQYPTDPA